MQLWVAICILFHTVCKRVFLENSGKRDKKPHFIVQENKHFLRVNHKYDEYLLVAVIRASTWENETPTLQSQVSKKFAAT